jgi:redox-sensitive bicupin YhaK (pirin superfamily)
MVVCDGQRATDPIDTLVDVIIEPRIRRVGSGEVRRLLPFATRRMVGPFVFLDVMGPDDIAPGGGIDVDAHPHIGLSTLTYLLAGRLDHRDSLGTVQTITAGEVNWMTAGSGVCHTERTPTADRSVGGPLFGVQMWVALPDGAQDDDPSFEHTDAADVPVLEERGLTVRLAAGTNWGAAAPVRGSSPLVLADVMLSGGRLDLGREHAELAVLALDGAVTVGGRELDVGTLAVLDDADGDARVVSGSGRAVVIGGEPLGRRHIWWNFVHSDPDRINDAKQRWLDQRFPIVPGDHDPFVPLPAD